MDDVDAVHRPSEDVALHAVVHVTSAQVSLTDLAKKVRKPLGNSFFNAFCYRFLLVSGALLNDG